MRHALTLACVLAACAGGEDVETGGDPLTRAECDARATSTRDACVARCATEKAAAGAHAGECQSTTDRSLAIAAQTLVGVGVGARGTIVVPFEMCLGAALTSTCADDAPRARAIAAGYGTGGAPLVDAWERAGQGLSCDTAKWVVRAECVREKRNWATAHAVGGGTEAERQAGSALAIAIGVYDVQAAAWLRDRRACAGDDEACVEECAPGTMDRLQCRWECPVRQGETCTPLGYTASCGVVDRSFAWDSLYACECSADTAACRSAAP